MTPIYMSWDKSEGRIDARLYIASAAAISDSEIGRHESEVHEIENDESIDDAERQRRLDYMDDNPFYYDPADADEAYEDMTGERIPRGMYAFFEDGELFLGAHTDLAGDASQDEREAVWAEFRQQLERNNFAPEWIEEVVS